MSIQMVELMVYGFLLGAVLLLCWASKDHVIQRLGLWMLVSWAGSNLAVGLLGFDEAPMVAPAFNAFVAIMVAVLGYRTKNFAVLTVFLLFLVEQAINWTCYAEHVEGGYSYYAILNGIFVLRMCVVGGSACVQLADRLHSRDPGVFHRHLGSG